MDLAAMLRQMQGGGEAAGPGGDMPLPDTAETVHISSLALLKMLIHGRAGVPMEVMGLMIGEFIDEYTVRVVDVFSFPQSGTGVSVEAVDPEYQAAMLGKLEQVGRPEKAVGWYHSHPGFGCWLSSVDVNTAQSFEQLNKRSVAVVVDPIQSVKGKVVIDAFRCIPQQHILAGIEPRQTTSNIGFLNRPTLQAIIRGLNRHYYSMPVAYRKNEHEIKMLLNVYKKGWEEGLKCSGVVAAKKEREERLKELRSLTLQFVDLLRSGKDDDDVANVGKVNARMRLKQESDTLLSDTVNQSLNYAINAITF
eukprot:PhM_4_TR11961/c0_g1_i1/m.30965/K03030/PSMD14, RPN11, POH1; 26S proteasome regulatory subunit N11